MVYPNNMFHLKSQWVSPQVLGLFASMLALMLTLKRGIENLGIPDAGNYVDQARGMLNGWAYMVENPNSFLHGLGFSASIALTFLITSTKSLLLFKLLLVIGHGLSTYLVAKIGIQLELSQRFWILGAILFSLDPFVLMAATDIQTESITTLIVLYWCYLYIMPLKQSLNPPISIILFTLSGFYSVLMRPNSLLPFLFIAVLVYLKCFHENIRSVWVGVSITLFLSLIGIFEIAITRLYSGFVFLSPIGGQNAEFMCRTEFIPQYLGYASVEQNEQINAIPGLTSSAAKQLIQNPDLSVSQLNHELTNLGVNVCLANPIQSAWVLFLKTFALWRPYAVFGAYGFEVFIGTLLIWLPLTFSAILFLTYKRLSATGILMRNYFIVMSIGFTISLFLTPTQIRHRVAFAEPFYWIFMMCLIDRLLKARASKTRFKNT